MDNFTPTQFGAFLQQAALMGFVLQPAQPGQGIQPVQPVQPAAQPVQPAQPVQAAQPVPPARSEPVQLVQPVHSVSASHATPAADTSRKHAGSVRDVVSTWDAAPARTAVAPASYDKSIPRPAPVLVPPPGKKASSAAVPTPTSTPASEAHASLIAPTAPRTKLAGTNVPSAKTSRQASGATDRHFSVTGLRNGLARPTPSAGPSTRASSALERRPMLAAALLRLRRNKPIFVIPWEDRPVGLAGRTDRGYNLKKKLPVTGAQYNQFRAIIKLILTYTAEIDMTKAIGNQRPKYIVDRVINNLMLPILPEFVEYTHDPWPLEGYTRLILHSSSNVNRDKDKMAVALDSSEDEAQAKINNFDSTVPDTVMTALNGPEVQFETTPNAKYANNALSAYQPPSPPPLYQDDDEDALAGNFSRMSIVPPDQDTPQSPESPPPTSFLPADLASYRCEPQQRPAMLTQPVSPSPITVTATATSTASARSSMATSNANAGAPLPPQAHTPTRKSANNLITPQLANRMQETAGGSEAVQSRYPAMFQSAFATLSPRQSGSAPINRAKPKMRARPLTNEEIDNMPEAIQEEDEFFDDLCLERLERVFGGDVSDISDAPMPEFDESDVEIVPESPVKQRGRGKGKGRGGGRGGGRGRGKGTGRGGRNGAPDAVDGTDGPSLTSNPKKAPARTKAGSSSTTNVGVAGGSQVGGAKATRSKTSQSQMTEPQAPVRRSVRRG